MPDTTPERRENSQLRAVLPAACKAQRPFFDQATQWGGQSHDHLAYLTLKEHFPDLSPQDTYMVVSTARRLFASGKLPASPTGDTHV